ncbi:MAG TPA: hypothetical protein VIW46_09305 [Acidimicrobiia bacterium]
MKRNRFCIGLGTLFLVGLLALPGAAGDKSAMTVSGEATAVNAEKSLLTVKTSEGDEVVFKVNDQTKIVRGEQPIELGAIVVGDNVVVDYSESDEAKVALTIGVKMSEA